MSARILVVEDEGPVRLGLVDLLAAQGHVVLAAETGPEGLVKAKSAAPDLVILDVMLPGLDGFGVLRGMRAAGLDVPVLMLTARGTELDKVTGFALGVDDYVTKPFSMLELLGRVGALLRRGGPGKSTAPALETLAFADITVDFARLVLARGGQPVPLPPRAIELLAALARAQGSPVSRDQLLDEVWGTDVAANPRTVDNMVVKLRQAIEEDAAHPARLLTVHGRGYRLSLGSSEG